MAGSALITPDTLVTSAIAVAELVPSGVLTRATMPPSARIPVACSSRSSAWLDCELGSWKPPTCSDFQDPSSQSRSEEHTSELQSHLNLVCRLLLEKKKKLRQILHTQITR